MNNKTIFEKAILYLLPELSLEGTPWKSLWRQKQLTKFATTVRLVGTIGAITYILHYFLVDIPSSAQPLHYWAIYRFTMCFFLLLTVTLTYKTNFHHSIFYKIPLTLSGLAGSLFQVASMNWQGRVPEVFVVVVPAIFVWALGFSVLISILILFFIFLIQWKFFLNEFFLSKKGWGDIEFLSGYLLGLIGIALLRGGYNNEVKSFIQDQQLRLERKKAFDAQTEVISQVRSFLPKEIFRRAIYFQKKRRSTFLQAMDEVLKIEEKTIACVYSDIRGYTTASKDLRGFLSRALPNIRLMTQIGEENNGISRTIGDLVLIYFDFEVRANSLNSALKTAMHIVEQNHIYNSNLPEEFQIKRFAIISFGTALTGNIGGINSAREITAMGPPMNLVSRLDALTKEIGFLNLLPQKFILFSNSAATAILEINPNLSLEKLDLKKHSFTIKDFPEEDVVWFLSLNSVALDAITHLQLTKDSSNRDSDIDSIINQEKPEKDLT